MIINRPSCAYAFQGTLVKLTDDQREQLEQTLKGDQQKLAQVDFFCKRLDKEVQDTRNAPDSSRVTMTFDDSNKVKGLQCRLKYAVDNFYKRGGFPELAVKVFEPSIETIKTWLQENTRQVDGRDKVIGEINNAIKRSRHIDFSYQGILPYEVRRDFTEFDKKALETFRDTLKATEEAFSAVAEIDPSLKRHKVMIGQRSNDGNEYRNGRYLKPNQPTTSTMLTTDIHFIKRAYRNILQEHLPKESLGKFNNNSEGLQNLCEWLRTNIIAPCNLLVEEHRANIEPPVDFYALAN